MTFDGVGQCGSKARFVGDNAGNLLNKVVSLCASSRGIGQAIQEHTNLFFQGQVLEERRVSSDVLSQLVDE